VMLQAPLDIIDVVVPADVTGTAGIHGHLRPDASVTGLRESIGDGYG